MKPPASIARFLALLATTFSLAAAPQLSAGTVNAGNNNWASAPHISQDPDASGSDISATTSILAFNDENGEPGHAPNSTNGAEKTAWWRWTAPADGYCTVDTLRTAERENNVNDTVIAVYTGVAVNNLTLVGSNDNHSGLVNPVPYLSSFTFLAKKDTLYHIAVDARTVDDVNATHFNVVMQIRLLKLAKTSRATVFYVEPTSAGMGMITLDTTTTGSLSGKLSLGAKVYPFKGFFTSNGKFQAVIPQKGPGNIPATPITLSLDGTGDGAFDLERGNGKFSVGFLPEKLVFTAQDPNPTTGIYPCYMDHGSPAGFGGEGVFIITIKSTGAVTGVGNTLDGIPVSWSTAIYKRTEANYAEIPAYKSLLGGKAALLLGPQLNEGGPVDTINIGGSIYIRSPNISPTFYKDGLLFEFDLRGSTYTKPAADKRALFFLDNNNGNGTLTVTKSGTELTNTLVDNVNLSTKNKFIFASTVNKASLTINTTNGLITGSITEPGGKKRTIKAVLTYTNGEPSVHGYATGATRNIPVTLTP